MAAWFSDLKAFLTCLNTFCHFWNKYVIYRACKLVILRAITKLAK